MASVISGSSASGRTRLPAVLEVDSGHEPTAETVGERRALVDVRCAEPKGRLTVRHWAEPTL